MSIGGDLAQARGQAGLTIAQVSQRTCIRETLIRGMERDDFTACGGDFYARGHIRSIARAAGADPEPLIREYDAARGAVQPVSAAEAFRPAAPLRMRERSRLNWSMVLSLALLAAVSFGVYLAVDHYVLAPSSARHAAQVRKTIPAHHDAHHKRRHRHRAVVIELTATSDCWVRLTTASGRVIFIGTVPAGTAEKWTEHRSVQLRLGNPPGVLLRVNGRRKARSGSSVPVTLTFGPGKRAHR